MLSMQGSSEATTKLTLDDLSDLRSNSLADSVVLCNHLGERKGGLDADRELLVV